MLLIEAEDVKTECMDSGLLCLCLMELFLSAEEQLLLYGDS